MGTIDPSKLTHSGENCLRRLSQLALLGLPAEQFLSAVTAPVEAHVSKMLAYLVRESGVDESLLGRALLRDAERSMAMNWPNRLDWLKRGFGIEIKGGGAWQRFDTVIQARNAIIHGDGHMSDQQEAMPLPKILELKRRLREELGIGWRSGRLAYGHGTAVGAHDAARCFVEEFDTQLLKAFPELRRV